MENLNRRCPSLKYLRRQAPVQDGLLGLTLPILSDVPIHASIRLLRGIHRRELGFAQ